MNLAYNITLMENRTIVPSTLNICIDGVLSEALMISTNSFVEYQMGQCAHQKSIPELCAGCRGDCNRTNRKLDKN